MEMIRRAWILPFNEHETPAGYCSRLAAWNGCSGAWDFCADMGLSYADIVDGDHDALNGLCVLTGVDTDAFKANSFMKMKVGQRFFTIRGNEETAAHSRRSYIRVCPECLAGDLAANPGHGAAALFQRVHWQLSWARCCAIHGVALQVIAQGRTGAYVDFIKSVRPLLGDLASGRIGPTPLPATGLERYLLGRIYDRAGSVADVLWLNELPLFKAVRLCEVLGSVSLFGPNIAIKGMDEATVAAAGAAGFDLLRAGPDALEEMLRGLMAAFWKTSGKVGGGKIFGILHEWLQSTMDDGDFDPIRNFVRSMMRNDLPVDSFTPVYRRPINDRKVCSIVTIAHELKVQTRILREYLISKEVIKPYQKDTPNEKLIFSVEEIKTILDPLRDLLSSKSAANYLGMLSGLFWEIVEMGYISPAFPEWKRMSYGSFFLKSVLDDFQSHLSSFVTMQNREAEMLSIRMAAMARPGGLAGVVKLLLDGKLLKVACRPGAIGYKSMLVDSNDIDRVTSSKNFKKVYSAQEAASYMRLGRNTIFSLISRGFIPHQSQNFRFGGKRFYINMEDLEEFNRKYISLAMACKKTGYAKVRKMIAEKGIMPAIEAKFGSAEFYLRDDLEC